MSVAKEPAYTHGTPPKTAVVLVNLGTPEAADAPALRRYLGQFLADPRVVEIPKLVWMPILHGIILRVRPRKSAEKYASIWTPEGSPLRVWTQRQAARVEGTLGERGHRLLIRHAMRYGQPSVGSVLDELKAQGATRILVVPMYPQYSGATTASVMDEVFRWGLQTRLLPELRHINHFHDDPAYIEALAATVRAHWQKEGRIGVGHKGKLVMSFHGMPHRTLMLGDPYHCECHKTGRLLAERLGLKPDEYMVTFQSRFGKARWLEPYTEPSLKALAEAGNERVDVICPAFVSDCIETLEEIAMEARETFLHHGGKAFHYIPCLNDQPQWITALCDLIERHLQGWPTQPVQQPTEAALKAQCERARAMGAAR
ncbi:ferrochelatase [Aquabacterium fontiphilum]|uniref:ferrochelatase n=1 Tax=Aquabacterium fontiphilum TaxID=450365 RepID=UPI001378CC6E|nr:ferrochelatase [Aquabacterium fontiphilum]NBD21901.1 ferrochelatase [Aquabacterium fontiphilum]